MKILLINTNQEKFDTVVMPIGLAYVASYLKKLGHTVKITDLCFVKNIPAFLSKEILSFQPQLIGLSIRNIDTVSFIYPNWQLEKIREIVNVCKNTTTSPIVVGGAAVSILPKEILRYLGLRYAVIGDGEEVLGQIAEKMSLGIDFTHTPGLARLESARFIPAQPNRCQNFSWSRLADWVNLKPYFRAQAGIPIQTKRGCQ